MEERKNTIFNFTKKGGGREAQQVNLRQRDRCLKTRGTDLMRCGHRYELIDPPDPAKIRLAATHLYL